MSIANKYKDLLANLDGSVEYWAEGAVLDFTEELARIMAENDISRADLAKKVGTSQAYITKVFGGQANFTIETMTKLALAVDYVLRLHIAPKGSRTLWNDVISCDSTQISDAASPKLNLVIGTAKKGPDRLQNAWRAEAQNNGAI